MVRIIDADDVISGKVKYVEYAGRSTDTKPTSLGDGLSVATGSVFIEVDTGNAYLYDEVGTSWHKVGGSVTPNDETR